MGNAKGPEKSQSWEEVLSWYVFPLSLWKYIQTLMHPFSLTVVVTVTHGEDGMSNQNSNFDQRPNTANTDTGLPPRWCLSVCLSALKILL